MPHLRPHITSLLSAADRRLIDDEHAHLERFLRDLCGTCCQFESTADCQRCSKEQIASCRGRLPSFFHDFLDLVFEHFENEEKLMRNVLQSPDETDYLWRHHEEHKNLLRDVKQQIQACSTLSQQGNTAEAIRVFHQHVSEIFSEHARTFDSALL